MQHLITNIASKPHFKEFDRWLRKEAAYEYSRVRSLVHCQAAFEDTSLTADTLALHLAFYLASYGMYRGSTRLLKMSYEIHVPVAKVRIPPAAAALRVS